ncbi:MAG TPA: META domain-containing protein [Candidatus Eisenbacteria bacterium]|nr:META domain-containing protein [Candidatus Eisenbacteria bacterium]
MPRHDSPPLRTIAAIALALAAAAVVPSVHAAADLSPPGIEEAKSATYHGLEGDSVVTLVKGRWEGPPFVEGGVVRPHVNLVRDFLVAGDLDADGAPEGVVFLAQGLGGSGEFAYVAVLDRRPDGVANVATAKLGDQVQVRSATIAKGRLLLDVVEVGELDPRCCPGEWVTRAFTLGPKGLTEVLPRAKSRRLTPAALGGGPWILRSWDLGEPLADSVEVTLALNGNVIEGDGGCNRYAVPYKSGDLAGDIRLGPIAETRMACPEPANSVETRYLDLLGRARKFSFVAGALYLTWERGGAYGTMIFERK